MPATAGAGTGTINFCRTGCATGRKTFFQSRPRDRSGFPVQRQPVRVVSAALALSIAGLYAPLPLSTGRFESLLASTHFRVGYLVAPFGAVGFPLVFRGIFFRDTKLNKKN